MWDWTRKKRVNFFYNGNPRGTSITSLHIINQEVGAMILSASGEQRADRINGRGLNFYSRRNRPFVPQLRSRPWERPCTNGQLVQSAERCHHNETWYGEWGGNRLETTRRDASRQRRFQGHSGVGCSHREPDISKVLRAHFSAWS